MYPEDRVLIGVINRKRDLEYAHTQHWYRIPYARAPRFIDVEYLAFFLSHSFGERNGGIHYYAQRTGYELVRRRDLLPNESQRADDVYYKMELANFQEKIPPILNSEGYAVSFILTTWDRFNGALTVADLYSKEDWFVERVAKTLTRLGIQMERHWQAEDRTQRLAELRIHCQLGIISATRSEQSADPASAVEDIDTVALRLISGDSDADVAAGAATIKAEIDRLGGPVFVDLPSV